MTCMVTADALHPSQVAELVATALALTVRRPGRSTCTDRSLLVSPACAGIAAEAASICLATPHPSALAEPSATNVAPTSRPVRTAPRSKSDFLIIINSRRQLQRDVVLGRLGPNVIRYREVVGDCCRQFDQRVAGLRAQVRQTRLCPGLQRAIPR